MDITVVVLTYNSARWIDTCLRSLVAQHLAPAEILVVDDDSTDATLTIVEMFGARSRVPVRIIRNGSHNISRGRNLGLDAARTPLVAFIDSDAWAEPDWTSELVAAMVSRPDVAVVGGEIIPVHTSRFAEAIAVNDGTVRELTTRGILRVNGGNITVHRQRSGGERFDERWVHAEDLEYVHRVGRWAFVPQARVHHESRSTARGYFWQMYRYGLWKVRYTIHTRNVRLLEYVPGLVFLASIVLGFAVSPLLLLAYPALGVAETVFVVAYRRPAVRLVPLMLVGWWVKNTGWSLGVLGALVQPASWRPPAPGKHHSLTSAG